MASLDNNQENIQPHLDNKNVIEVSCSFIGLDFDDIFLISLRI